MILLLLGCSQQKTAPPADVGELVRHQNLGLAYLEENRVQEAKAEYEKVVQLAPAESLGYANLAICLMRLGDYPGAKQKAELALQKADDPDIRLIVAEIDDRSGNADQAIADAESALKKTPDHVRLNFKAAQLNIRKANWAKAEPQLKRAVDRDPGNLAIQLYRIEALVRTNRLSEAADQLQETRKQILDLPAQTNEYFQSTINQLHEGKGQPAIPAVIAIHNLLKPSPLYQRSIIELVGTGGASIGFPILHYSNAVLQRWKEGESKPAHLGFADATAASGLLNLTAAGMTTGDFNNDGHTDLFLAGPCRLLKNSGNKFTDVTAAEGIAITGGINAKFADYDNDGRLDLYVVSENGHALYHRETNGKFTDVTAGSGIHEKHAATPLFLDLDNEGDLDLLLLSPSGNRAYRNNGDGTFSAFPSGLGIQNTGATIAAFADFDEDGDLDLFLAGGSRSALFSNLRSGHFEEKKDSGLPAAASGAVSAADLDNDGLVDLLVDGSSYKNKGDATFLQPGTVFPNPIWSSFTDVDNDGRQDIIARSANQFVIKLNQGGGRFGKGPQLPPSLKTKTAAIMDYDSDGDEDLVGLDDSGKLHLLRNDGGNTNYWINVRPVGLGPESGKNNRNSIGAKVEVKAGTLYQMAVVTDPVVHFGLGDRKAADVVRVVWTNGTSQNHIQPGSNQTIVEKQVLKGSCAFLYAWNGSKYEFVTDILWKSALGMPLGIMAGEMRFAFPNSTQEYLRVPGKALQLKDGAYSIRITEELWEAAFMDQLRLILLDHPDTIDMYVDERFVIPPYPPLRLYPAFQKMLPLKASDDQGRDLLPVLKAKDDRYAATFATGDFQGIAATHDLILDLGRQPMDAHITLFLDGWLYPTDASINVAVGQSKRLQIVRPYVEVPDANGKWKTVVPDIGFPQGKDKMTVIDLDGKFPAQDYRIRIRTNMEIYYDQVFYTRNEPQAPYVMTPLAPSTADLHYRGYSRLYRKGQSGPHWFDYSSVSHEQKWRDLVGNYTRYGDVTDLLQEPDDRYVIINSADEISIRFDASKAPPLKKGWTRDFLIYSDGWMKDGDMSTATGKSVEPLPFHRMSQYPYDEAKESYPRDPLHQQFLREYNTRKVTAERFRKLEEPPTRPSGNR